MSAFGVVPEGRRRGSQAWEEGGEVGGYGGWDAGKASVEGEAGYCNAAAPYAQEDHGHGEGVRQGEEVGGACNLPFFRVSSSVKVYLLLLMVFVVMEWDQLA